jgi:hypothetical protein
MKTKTITDINLQTLRDISDHLQFSEFKQQPVQQTITHTDFNDLALNIGTILEAIEFIGFNGNENHLAICGGLAQIAQKILPINEMVFLDRLLLKTDDWKGKKSFFTPIDEIV